jgi:hypothetical protein
MQLPTTVGELARLFSPEALQKLTQQRITQIEAQRVYAIVLFGFAAFLLLAGFAAWFVDCLHPEGGDPKGVRIRFHGFDSGFVLWSAACFIGLLFGVAWWYECNVNIGAAELSCLQSILHK